MEKLKPCPFCGGEAKFEEGWKPGGCGWYIYCDKCDCQTVIRGTKRSAKIFWNRRVKEDR